MVGQLIRVSPMRNSSTAIGMRFKELPVPPSSFASVDLLPFSICALCRRSLLLRATPGSYGQCRDGSYSFSQSRGDTSSYHGGVAKWL